MRRLDAEFPPEFALAIKCCKAGFDPRALSGVVAKAGRVDWQKFAHIVQRHRIAGLAWSALVAAGAAPSGPIGELLAAKARNISIAGLRRANLSAQLLERFQTVGIELLFLKGLTLGKLAYGNPFIKESWDVDLLVRPGRIEEAGELLAKLGFACIAPAHRSGLQRWHRARKDSTWRDGDTYAELHSRLTDNPFHLLGLDQGWPRQTVEIAPGITLPTLETDELFAYLAVHGASSAWFRMTWLSDFAGLLHGRSDEEIARLYQLSQRLGAGRAAAQALLLTNYLFDVPLPAPLRVELDGDPINRWLASAALGQLLAQREPTVRPFGTGMIHLTQFMLQHGSAFKLRELRSQAGSALANQFSRWSGGDLA